MEEKLRKEREDAIEEAKLAAERERMRQDFVREKEKAKRKEVSKRSQLVALLHAYVLVAGTYTCTLSAKIGARLLTVFGCHNSCYICC